MDYREEFTNRMLSVINELIIVIRFDKKDHKTVILNDNYFFNLRSG